MFGDWGWVCVGVYVIFGLELFCVGIYGDDVMDNGVVFDGGIVEDDDGFFVDFVDFLWFVEDYVVDGDFWFYWFGDDDGGVIF